MSPSSIVRGPREVAKRLTRREREVLQALADGYTSREIAQLLHITIETLRTDVVNRAEPPRRNTVQSWDRAPGGSWTRMYPT